MFIGLEHARYCTGGSIKHGADGPVGTNTPLGWAAFGDANIKPAMAPEVMQGPNVHTRTYKRTRFSVAYLLKRTLRALYIFLKEVKSVDPF